MHSVVNNLVWKHINTDSAFDNFGSDPINMRLALALDGVNPFKLSNTIWLTWPMLTLIYSSEPWLVAKKYLISLCILISRKKSPSSTNIDIFIHPLVKELQELWRGVVAQDFSQPQGRRNFALRGILMWTFADFPTYGLIFDLFVRVTKVAPVVDRTQMPGW